MLTEYPTRRLFTDREFQLAQRAWDRIGMDDPTLDAPELTDDDAPEDDAPDAEAERRNFSDDPRDHDVALMFPPSFCQCGAMSIRGVSVDDMTREWVAMDRLDHHLGRPCGTKLWTL